MIKTKPRINDVIEGFALLPNGEVGDRLFTATVIKTDKDICWYKRHDKDLSDSFCYRFPDCKDGYRYNKLFSIAEYNFLPD